jgi:molybdopterin-guanine dinucleotide biosynthesis protein A
MFTISIQAGGESRRMGEDKALKLFLGEPLIARVVQRIRSLEVETMITASDRSKYLFLNLPVYEDIYPGKGALGGLYTALYYAKQPYIGLAACDMPFVSLQLFFTLLEIMIQKNLDVVIPTSPDGLEPLHGIYRRETCVKVVERMIHSGQMRMLSLLPEIKSGILEVEDVARIDPTFKAFINVNTPAEFVEAEKLAFLEVENRSRSESFPD